MTVMTVISRSEMADDYHKVIVHLNSRWRVIECPDNVPMVSSEFYNTASVEKRLVKRLGQAGAAAVPEKP